MGGQLLTSPSGGEQSPPTLYSTIFHEHFPFYLQIGMSAEDYWNGDSTLARAYRKAYELKKKERNQELWLQGLYIYEALLNVSPVFHDFAKHPKPLPYPKEPYPLTQKEEEERKAREEKLKMEKFKAITQAWAKRVNEKAEKEENG